MDLLKLDEPFDADDIEWRAQSCGKSNSGKFWVSVLAYVTNRAIMKRLDTVCGKGNWKNEYKDLPNNAGVECGISIKIDGEWVTKWAAAPNTQIEATKGGRSDAMKRAAVQWGIGRYLSDLEAGWGEDSQNGAHKAKTKQNEWFKWNPPKLPVWALPNNQPKQKPEIINENSGLNPDECLKNATNAMSACDMNTLQKLWGIYSKDLKPYPEHLAKLEEVKNIRKQELTPQA